MPRYISGHDADRQRDAELGRWSLDGDGRGIQQRRGFVHEGCLVGRRGGGDLDGDGLGVRGEGAVSKSTCGRRVLILFVGCVCWM